MLGLNKLSIGNVIETCSPAGAAIACAVGLHFYQNEVIALVQQEKISLANLYAAIFDWSAIQTGFLFAIYGFVAGKTDGFIGEIRKTRSMQRYGVYLFRAIFVGFLLTIASVPLIVTQYEVKSGETLLYYVVTAWVSLFMWAFFSFARVAYIFGILIKIKEPKSIPAG